MGDPSEGTNVHLAIEFRDHGNQQMKTAACGSDQPSSAD
jgi:hypothetical protein